MKSLAKKSNYYSGGFAEFVSKPSPLTYSFMKDWFTGQSSVGAAMKLLKLPYESSNVSILEMVNDELAVNLENEEKTLYEKTIFSYVYQTDIHTTPRLTIHIKKMFIPQNIANTLKIVFVQSQWIAHPEDMFEYAKKLIENIPELPSSLEIKKLDEILGTDIWPCVIAVGTLAEFYNQLIEKDGKHNRSEIQTYISQQIAKQDWFFSSLSDQEKVKNSNMSFDEYLKTYGIRSDRDYELSYPRWHEIRDTIKKRVAEYSHRESKTVPELMVNNKLKKLIDVYIELLILRSEAKRKTLIYINLLRQEILKKAKDSNIELLSKEEILNNTFQHTTHDMQDEEKSEKVILTDKGKGAGVAEGIVSGNTLRIENNDQEISKGTIGIFPNASPEFAVQYPKCSGMIFLKGGQTSHGAIVAREFGIPAIIAQDAESTSDGTKIEINGKTGEWKKV